MKTFVLIPGAWIGGWAWERVASVLRDDGHDVYSVTLTGLDTGAADCSHVSLATHVNDVLSLLSAEDLTEVILVGHGTSGVLAGMVADRMPERLAHVVYVEAFLPAQGQAVLDAFGTPVRDHELRLIAENAGRWPAPEADVLSEGQGLTEESAERLARRMVDHPGRPLTEPVQLSGSAGAPPSTFVVCALDHPGGRLPDAVERMRSAPGWRFETLDTGVFPMVSAPAELAALLERLACDGADGPVPTLRSSLPPSPAEPLGTD